MGRKDREDYPRGSPPVARRIDARTTMRTGPDLRSDPSPPNPNHGDIRGHGVWCTVTRTETRPRVIPSTSSFTVRYDPESGTVLVESVRDGIVSGTRSFPSPVSPPPRNPSPHVSDGDHRGAVGPLLPSRPDRLSGQKRQLNDPQYPVLRTGETPRPTTGPRKG